MKKISKKEKPEKKKIVQNVKLQYKNYIWMVNEKPQKVVRWEDVNCIVE